METRISKESDYQSMKARVYPQLTKEMKNDEGIDLARYGGSGFW